MDSQSECMSVSASSFLSLLLAETEVVKTLGPIILSPLSSLNYKMLSVA